MALVLEMGARHPEPILALLDKLIPRMDHVEILWTKYEHMSAFEKFNGSLEEAITAIREKKAVAVQFAPLENTLLASCMICSPRYSGLASDLWYASIDGIVSAENFRIGDIDAPEMAFISLSIEDSLDDLDDLPEITEQTFPWQHWRLAEAAVGNPSEVPVRAGPAFSKAKTQSRK